MNNPFYADFQDSRRREFVGLRVERTLNEVLDEASKLEGKSKSELIRSILESHFGKV